LVEILRSDFASGSDVALGFEAPLFIPVPADPQSIGRARQGEGNRPYSVGAGLTVTVMGLQQSAWVLRAVAAALESYEVTTDWRQWLLPEGPARLLLWEAFVTGAAKAATHAGDAVTAGAMFLAHEHALDTVNAVRAESPVSLVACAAMWAGLSIPGASLRSPVLVLKPTEPYSFAGAPA
jgi:hypothetical protein